MAENRIEYNNKIFQNSAGVRMELIEIANKNIVTSVTIKYKLFKSQSEKEITVEDSKYGLILKVKNLPECELQFNDKNLFSLLPDGTYNPTSIHKITCFRETMTKYRFTFNKDNIVNIDWK